MSINQALAEIYKELNLNGSTFDINEVENCLYEKASTSNKNISPLLEQLARLGARTATREFTVNDAKSVIRKQIENMTYLEFVHMLAMRERSIVEMLRGMRIARNILKKYPQWKESPNLTLKDVSATIN